jgi:hypothetical protein
VAQGNTSVIDAYKVGAKIEDLDANRILANKVLAQNATISGTLTVGEGGEIKMSEGNIFASGGISVSSGKIANWIIKENKLISANDIDDKPNGLEPQRRIELDQTKSRISIIVEPNKLAVAVAAGTMGISMYVVAEPAAPLAVLAPSPIKL